MFMDGEDQQQYNYISTQKSFENYTIHVKS